jgi:hypothetical protein
VTEGVGVFVGVNDGVNGIVGVTEGVGVCVNPGVDVCVCVGVNDGVIDGVGVTEDVGVGLGTIEHSVHPVYIEVTKSTILFDVKFESSLV